MKSNISLLSMIGRGLYGLRERRFGCSKAWKREGKDFSRPQAWRSRFPLDMKSVSKKRGGNGHEKYDRRGFGWPAPEKAGEQPSMRAG